MVVPGEIALLLLTVAACPIAGEGGLHWHTDELRGHMLPLRLRQAH